MMKRILFLLIAVIIIIIASCLVWLSTLDGHLSVSRQIEIDASPQQVYSTVADFNSWHNWNPWLCIDANSKTSIDGKGNQTGDTYMWTGELIGAGEIETIALTPQKEILQTVRYSSPMKSTSDIKFSFASDGDGVTVTWQMESEMPFLFRFLAKQMKPIISSDFERGLIMLKDYIETGTVASRVVIKGVESAENIAFVGKHENCTKKNIGQQMQKTMYEVSNWLVANSTMPEEGITVYEQFDATSDTCSYTSGFRLLQNKQFPFRGAQIDTIPASKIVKVTFYGDYHNLGNAWSAAYAYIQKNKLKASAAIPPYEIYLNDPAFFPNPSDWVTDVCIPIE